MGVAWQVGTFDTGALRCAVQLHTQALGCLLPLQRRFRCFWGQASTAAVSGSLRYLRGYSVFWKDDCVSDSLS